MGGRIAQLNSDEEAVQLSFRQGERALVFDWVLGAHNHERLQRLMSDAINGDLPFLHRLQKRGLGLGGRAVDLVDQDDLGEDGAGGKLEGTGVLVAEGNSADV